MILFITQADSDLLALRGVLESLPPDFPPVGAVNAAQLDAPPGLDGVEAAVVRLLGGRSAWEGPFDELRRDCVRRGVPLLAFAGETVADAELTALSTVAAGTVTDAFAYLVHGGPHNVEHFLRFVADTVLMRGFGFDRPEVVGSEGFLTAPTVDPSRPTVAVVFYRAHLLSGNTGFVEELCAALERREVNAVALWCYSLRPDAERRVRPLEQLRDLGVDAVITTVLAMGSTRDDEWDASQLAALGVPVVQAISATTAQDDWASSAQGLGPMDVATQVAIPEFDGRIISVPFSFKEVVDDDPLLGVPLVAYRTLPDRVERVAGIAARLAHLRTKEPAERRVVIVLSAYPTKRSRVGNAVGLDTPASAIELLTAMRQAGYAIDRVPADGDALMAELIDAFSYEVASFSPDQLTKAPGRLSGDAYRRWFATVDADAQEALVRQWGEPPGDVYVDDDDLVFAGIELGNVLLTVQPPRGFGSDPIAVYHSPDLVPTHHYLAFYRWLDESWGADAVVHLGKHGTMEWLPGKGLGLSAACYPDLALGDVPLVYPFVVNDPGEGTQAKRRGHAVVIDHLVPPMTRADTYDELARLERLLDEHARIASLDPAKLPAIREQVWELLVDAEITRDLGLVGAPEGEEFDDLVLHVDGYLCELKDAQIRGGLHVLGRPPEGDAEVDLVLAMTRVPQGAIPSLRAGLTVDADRHEVDRVEADNRANLVDLQESGWRYDGDDPTLGWICDRLVPALRRTTDEIEGVFTALRGGYVPAGPSGAPTRGMAHVLPTGRNFYSVDPKALPSPLSYDVGCALADRLIERHRREEGRDPKTVGLVLWGTAAMRTMGDDVAEALALMGVRPRWDADSGRVQGLELVPETELGRARVDVVLRISGFFRDAFPHLVELLDDAARLAGFVDGPRIFGSKPGAYGSGILPLLESRDWRSDEDLAAVYEAWGGWSYGRAGMGLSAAQEMRTRFATIEVAVKNQDNREHDIFDSDDYLQDHGGMVATIRALTGRQPKAWFGDSSDPARPRVRSLAEEAARVVRTRVLNPKWIGAMQRHGYKGAFELAATVDYLFGYDATAQVVEDWMYDRVTEAYVADPGMRDFYERSNPWALRSIAERLLEAAERGMWNASADKLATLRDAVLQAEGWEEGR